MIKFLYFLILSVCIFSSFTNIKSRVLEFIVALGMFVLFAGNNFNSDYNLYLFSFITDDYERYEIGYTLYYKLMKMIGINSYHITLVILLIILFTIILFCLKKYSKNYIPFFLFLLMGELFIETVQIRTFAASVFLFAAITYFQDNKLKSLLFLLLAASFQMVGLFYFPFFAILFLKNGCILKNNKARYQFVLFLFILYVLLLLLNNIGKINLILLLIRLVANKISLFEHASNYFGGTNWGSIPFALLYLSNIVTLWYLNRDTKKFNLKYKESILDINIYAAFCIPLLFIDMNFYRVFRILNIANFAYYISVLSTTNRNITYRYLKNLSIVFIMQIAWFLNYYIRVPEIFNDILSNNLWLR